MACRVWGYPDVMHGQRRRPRSPYLLVFWPGLRMRYELRHGRGRIILLNGASSSGKSTLARELQAELDTPFLYLSSDQLVDGGAIPGRRDESAVRRG